MELLFRMTLRSMIGVIGLDVDKDVLYLRELMDDLGFDTISKLMRSSNSHARINQHMQIGIYIALCATRANAMRIQPCELPLRGFEPYRKESEKQNGTHRMQYTK